MIWTFENLGQDQESSQHAINMNWISRFATHTRDTAFEDLRNGCVFLVGAIHQVQRLTVFECAILPPPRIHQHAVDLAQMNEASPLVSIKQALQQIKVISIPPLLRIVIFFPQA